MPTIRYTGDGTSFLNGVPARHLTTEEYDALPVEARAAVRDSSLYAYEAYRKATQPDSAHEAADRPKLAASLAGEAADQSTAAASARKGDN